MKELIDNLMGDGVLSMQDKLEMLTDWEKQWHKKMATSIQSQDQLAYNLAELKIIQEAIKELKNKPKEK